MTAQLKIAFAEWRASAKIFPTALLLAVLVFFQMLEYEQNELLAGKHVTAWITPYLMFPLMLVAFSFAIIALFGNNPYCSRYTEFVIVRSGRSGWFLSKIISVFISTFLFSLFLSILPIALAFPYADFKAQLDSSMFIPINGKSAVWASVVEWLMIWLVSMWLSLFMMLVNLLSNSRAGIPVGCVLCLFSYVFQIYRPFSKIIYFSPISWMDIRVLNWNGSNRFNPSFLFAIIALTFGIILFCVFSWLVIRQAKLDRFIRRNI